MLLILGFALGFGVLKGTLETTLKFLIEKIDKLEIKQDKHNSLIERMTIVEQSTKSAHHRLDELKKE